MKHWLWYCIVLGSLAACSPHPDKEPKITEYVDLFPEINNGKAHFPGAAVPFGALQLSPVNPNSSNYEYTDTLIAAFSHFQFKGIFQEIVQDLRFLPVVTRPDSSDYPAGYLQNNYAVFSHEHESAEPGYYTVTFNNGITTELSVTPRCGFYYYQFPPSKTYALAIDLTNAQYKASQEVYLRKLNNRTLEGYRKSLEPPYQQSYFVIEFSQDCQVWAGKHQFQLFSNGERILTDSCYLWVDFGKATNKILTKVSFSSANCEGAFANLEKELPHWSFDKVKRDAKHLWRKELSKTKVEGKDEKKTKAFYTALYRCYLTPCLYSDVNGNYKGADGEIHSVTKHEQYIGFPVTEVYRTPFPWFMITQKKRMSDWIHSLLKHYDICGKLPASDYPGYEVQLNSTETAIALLSDVLRKVRKTDTVTQDIPREIMVEETFPENSTAASLFSALGLSPVSAVEGHYQLSIPAFDRIILKTEPERKFVITTERLSPGATTVKKILLNGVSLSRNRITYNEIMQGGKLEFILDSAPGNSL